LVFRGIPSARPSEACDRPGALRRAISCCGVTRPYDTVRNGRRKLAKRRADGPSGADQKRQRQRQREVWTTVLGLRSETDGDAVPVLRPLADDGVDRLGKRPPEQLVQVLENVFCPADHAERPPPLSVRTPPQGALTQHLGPAEHRDSLTQPFSGSVQ